MIASRPAVAGIVLFLGILGCDSAPQPSLDTNIAVAADAAPLMPLAVGNRWVMTSALNERIDGLDSLYVTDSLALDGTTWFTVKSTFGILRGALANRPDGLYRQPSAHLYPLDLADGERLETSSGYVEVLERNAQVVLPDGRTVEGIRFAETTTRATIGAKTLPVRAGLPAEMVFAFGIGPVRLECPYLWFNATGDSLVVVNMRRLDLVRYHVAP